MTPRDLAILAAVTQTRRFSQAQTALILAALVPGTGLDPFLFSLLMGAVYANTAATDPDKAGKMARWPLDEWKAPVKQYVADLAAEAGEGSVSSVTSVTPPPQRDRWRPAGAISAETSASAPGESLDIAAPPIKPDDVQVDPGGGSPPGLPPEPPQLPPGRFGGFTGPIPGPGELAPIPAPPPGLPNGLRDAWIEARTRAGDLCRGLGNYLDTQAQAITSELWDGERIRIEADPELRARMRGTIDQATADAIANGWTTKRLASEYGNLTLDWSRNWQRIAETELQGAFNSGVVLNAARTYGDEAQVARIPEASACAECVRVFLDGEWPIVFPVGELVANGTNAGKKPAEWQATCWPVHPRCRCSTMAVPPGMRPTRTGRLVSAKQPAGASTRPYSPG